MSAPTEPVGVADDSTAIDNPRAALRTPLFRTLIVGWTLTNFADSLLSVILAVWVAELTGSIFLGGITFAVLGLPAVLAPFIGYMVDRISRRRMLAVAYGVGGVALLPMLMVTDSSGVWVIFICAFIYSTVAYVTTAGQSGLLKDTIPTVALGHANGILSMIDQVFRLSLPILGAAVYAWVGIRPLIIAAALGFILAGVIFALLRVKESSPERGTDSLWRELVAGFQHLFSVRPMSIMAGCSMFAVAALGLLNGSAFAVLRHLGLPEALLGPLIVGQGIGGIVAGFIAPRLMIRFGRVRVFSVAVIGLGLSLLPFAGDSVVLLAVSQLAVGLTITTAIVAFVTERQIASPERLQGRVSTAAQVVMNVPGVIATAGAASLVAVVDHRLVILASVALLVAAGLAAARGGRK